VWCLQDRKYRKPEESAKSDPPARPSKPAETIIEYVDMGDHWCKNCKYSTSKLVHYLEHIQTGAHMKVTA